MTNWTPEDIENVKRRNPDLAKVNPDMPGEKSRHVQTAIGEKINKYHAHKTYSRLCGRVFDSKAEAVHGEELALLQKAGEINDLRYQVEFVLSESPKVTISIDFAYLKEGKCIFEDTKGVLTRDFRTKLVWLKEKHGVEVQLLYNRYTRQCQMDSLHR